MSNNAYIYHKFNRLVWIKSTNITRNIKKTNLNLIDSLCLDKYFNEQLNIAKYENITTVVIGAIEEFDEREDGGRYNHTLKNKLPKTLKYLEINSKTYDKSLDDLLYGLDHLETLVLNCPKIKWSNMLQQKTTIKNLVCTITQSFDTTFLPNSLEELSLKGKYQKELSYWPQSLKILSLEYGICSSISNLPNSLEELLVRTNNDFNLDMFPSNLKKLNILHTNINENCTLVLPNSLEYAIFYTRFYDKKFNIPPAMKYMFIGDNNYIFLHELALEYPTIVNFTQQLPEKLTSDEIKYGKSVANVLNYVSVCTIFFTEMEEIILEAYNRKYGTHIDFPHADFPYSQKNGYSNYKINFQNDGFNRAIEKIFVNFENSIRLVVTCIKRLTYDLRTRYHEEIIPKETHIYDFDNKTKTFNYVKTTQNKSFTNTHIFFEWVEHENIV